jgi:antirestriction protein ArdC
MKTETTKISTEQKIANQLVKAMESGQLAWRKPWTLASGRQQNLVTGNCYHAGNFALTEIISACYGWPPFWLTFNGGRANGLKLTKGEKATYISKPVMLTKDEEQEDGTIAKSGFTIFKTVAIFNAAQFEQCEKLDRMIMNRTAKNGLVNRTEPERIEAAENILTAWEVPVRFGGDKAAYSPVEDKIYMPERKQFENASGLYSTWAHECIHSTGHKKRLGRDMSGMFGSESYAKEELIAELGSVIACSRLQIGYEIENHASYLQSWIKVLKESPKFVMTALRQATNAANLLIPETEIAND